MPCDDDDDVSLVVMLVQVVGLRDPYAGWGAGSRKELQECLLGAISALKNRVPTTHGIR
jgi:hypothetical protein